MGELGLFRFGSEYDPNRIPLGAFCAVCGTWGYWFAQGTCEGCLTIREEKNAHAYERRVLR